MKVSEVSSGQSIGSEPSKAKQSENVSKKEKVSLQAGEEKAKEQTTNRKQVTKKKVKEGIKKLNETIQTFHEELKFEMHNESERMMTKIVNTKKHEVIKEIPPKEMLDLLGRIKDMVGLILDEKI